jgi:hypothetical protein
MDEKVPRKPLAMRANNCYDLRLITIQKTSHIQIISAISPIPPISPVRGKESTVQ